jgi:hypothetical protein
MNLFVSDSSPVISARNLDDKRVRHMPKETLEMLIMSVYKNFGIVIYPFIIWGGDYRKSRVDELFYNPVTEWVARKKANTWWTYKHLYALFEEFHYRFGYTHYLYHLAASLSHFFKEIEYEPTSFCNATGEIGTNVIELYKECLIKKWFVTDEIKPVIWTRRGEPIFVSTGKQEQLDLFLLNKEEIRLQREAIKREFEDEDLPF